MNALDQHPAPLADISPRSITGTSAFKGLRQEDSQTQRWSAIEREAVVLIEREPTLSKALHGNVLDHPNLESALARRLAHKLACADICAVELNELFEGILARVPAIGSAAWGDLLTVVERDPACKSMLTPLLHFNGFLALQIVFLACDFASARCGLSFSLAILLLRAAARPFSSAK